MCLRRVELSAMALISGGGGTVKTPTRDESFLAHPVTCHYAKGGDPTTDNYLVTGGFFDVAHSLSAEGFDASEDGTGRGTPLVPVAIQGAATRENSNSGPDGVGVRIDGIAYTLEARQEVQAVMTLAIRGRDGNTSLEVRDDGTANAVLTPNGGRAGIGVGAIARGTAVRRLTPRECERLQGFPDDYTKISDKTADGPRYKALGNSMAVPVMRWIGERIAMVDALSISEMKE